MWGVLIRGGFASVMWWLYGGIPLRRECCVLTLMCRQRREHVGSCMRMCARCDWLHDTQRLHASENVVKQSTVAQTLRPQFYMLNTGKFMSIWAQIFCYLSTGLQLPAFSSLLIIS
jgi:hypothetical protein